MVFDMRMPYLILLLASIGGQHVANALRRSALDRTNWCTSTKDYMNGSWVYDPSPDLKFPFTTAPAPKRRSQCDQTQREVLAGAPLPNYIRYKWKPNTCDIETFDPLAFCQNLDGQTIGVIGDSTSESFAMELAGLVEGYVDVEVIDNTWPKPVELCTKYGHTVHLLFKRSDFFPTKPKDFDDLGLVLARSDIAVLNWGVHVTPDQIVRTSIGANSSDSSEIIIPMAASHQPVSQVDSGATGPYPKTVKEVIQTYWHPRPMSNVFWRASIAYHWHCEVSPQVFADVHDPAIQTEMYHSNDVYSQERQIIWPVMQELGVTLLRSDAMLMLRADGHRVVGDYGKIDCLHYCEPGPQDTWVQLFYHHLMGHIGA